MKKKYLYIGIFLLIFTGNYLLASAGTYHFSFPDYTQSVGSMRWTGTTQLVSTGQNPYVYPDPTMYHRPPYSISGYWTVD